MSITVSVTRGLLPPFPVDEPIRISAAERQCTDFRVRNANLYYDLELAPWEAVLGTTLDIPTLEGTVSLKIPPGTKTQQQLRLRARGLPAHNGTRGDLYAIVSVQVPTQVYHVAAVGEAK